MKYDIEFKPQALKDGKKIPKQHLKRIFSKLERLSDGLQGDVKHLTDFSPEYRLRVGEYRVLFEIDAETIIIYRIRHRKDVYR